MRIQILATLAPMALTVAACGGTNADDAAPASASPSASASSAATTPATDPTTTAPVSPPPDLSSVAVHPACAKTWVAGVTLPEQYTGCDWRGEASGDEYATLCIDGTQLWALEGDGGSDEFFALPGQKVQAAKGTAYNKAFARCTG